MMRHEERSRGCSEGVSKVRKKHRWNLRKKLMAALIALSLCTTSVLYVSTEQTNEPAQEQTANAEEFTPTPLVIDTPEEPDPLGAYYGTVVITGQGIEGGGYEGLMFITMDGEYIRVTCTDAVRSRFGDNF